MRTLPLIKFGHEPVDHLPYFSHAISHLKEYEEVYSAWSKSKEMIEDNVGLRDLLEDKIRVEMRKKDNYPSLLEMNVGVLRLRTHLCVDGDTAISVEISVCNTSTKRSLYRAPFGKISKSGDGGGSGGCIRTNMRI